jgi:hypothetical protein
MICDLCNTPIQGIGDGIHYGRYYLHRACVNPEKLKEKQLDHIEGMLVKLLKKSGQK